MYNRNHIVTISETGHFHILIFKYLPFPPVNPTTEGMECGEETSDGLGQAKTYTCPEPLTGQYVLIQRTDEDVTLTLCEVVVDGYGKFSLYDLQ